MREEANLMEDPGKELRMTTDHSVRFDLHPFEIKTIRLAPLRVRFTLLSIQGRRWLVRSEKSALKHRAVKFELD